MTEARMQTLAMMVILVLSGLTAADIIHGSWNWTAFEVPLLLVLTWGLHVQIREAE